MRLVRLGQQPSRVAEDIRAALASLGRGNNVVGGVALIGPRPLPTAKPVDAVVLLPRGLILVLGVDLPDPAIRLEAPLTGQWKADGWPLVGPGSTANPAVGALALASSIARHVSPSAPESLPIGTIVAVGPFVETVNQPAADLAGKTLVLHPTPTSMLAATVSLAAGERPCTVDEARALLRVLAPEATPLADELLIAEGFASIGEVGAHESAGDGEDPVTAKMPAPEDPPSPVTVEMAAPAAADPSSTVTAKMAAPAAKPATRPAPPAGTLPPLVPSTPRSSKPPQPPQTPRTSQPPRISRKSPAPRTPRTAPQAPARPKPIEVTAPVPMVRTPLVTEQNSRAVRWLPLGAIGLLAVILVTAIVLALTRSADSPAPAPAAAAPPVQTVQGVQFIQRASGTEQNCADHAYGDLQTSLQATACTMMRRGSFETSSNGRTVAVSIAVVYFGDEAAASAFKTAADTPGGGGVTDIATESRKWPTRTPEFSGSAYASSVTGTAVRMVLTTWFDGPSAENDPTLVQIAHVALSVQIS